MARALLGFQPFTHLPHSLDLRVKPPRSRCIASAAARASGRLFRFRRLVSLPDRAQGRLFVASDARRPRPSAALDERAMSAL